MLQLPNLMSVSGADLGMVMTLLSSTQNIIIFFLFLHVHADYTIKLL